jgi:hypothetical protein
VLSSAMPPGVPCPVAKVTAVPAVTGAFMIVPSEFAQYALTLSAAIAIRV